MTEGTVQDFQRLAARADLARLLAASYYQPTAEFAQERVFDALAEAAAAVDPQLSAPARRVAEGFAANDEQALLVDYARLFLGPPKALAPPYGSVWLAEAQPLMQESTLAVLDLYRDAGFALVDDFRDLPDHIAVELECLYVTLFRRAQAAQQGDSVAAARVAALQDRLLREHLWPWLTRFAGAVRDNAETSFYRELATLTEQVVERELGFAH